MYPRAGAEFEYVSNAFGRRLAFVVGWLIIFSGILGAATVSLGFAGYFSDLVGLPVLPSAILIIFLLAGILLYSAGPRPGASPETDALDGHHRRCPRLHSVPLCR